MTLANIADLLLTQVLDFPETMKSRAAAILGGSLFSINEGVRQTKLLKSKCEPRAEPQIQLVPPAFALVRIKDGNPCRAVVCPAAFTHPESENAMILGHVGSK